MMYDINKDECVNYPNTLHDHGWKPGIVIENNNCIYVIGDGGYQTNRWGVIECYDIRVNKWILIDELNNELKIDKQNRYFQWVL